MKLLKSIVTKDLAVGKLGLLKKGGYIHRTNRIGGKGSDSIARSGWNRFLSPHRVFNQHLLLFLVNFLLAGSGRG